MGNYKNFKLAIFLPTGWLHKPLLLTTLKSRGAEMQNSKTKCFTWPVWETNFKVATDSVSLLFYQLLV